MEIEFSQHSKDQIKRRGIAKKKVVETIETGKHEVSFRERKTYRKKFGQKMLEVVTVDEGSKLIIITAYYIYENKLRS